MFTQFVLVSLIMYIDIRLVQVDVFGEKFNCVI